MAQMIEEYVVCALKREKFLFEWLITLIKEVKRVRNSLLSLCQKVTNCQVPTWEPFWNEKCVFFSGFIFYHHLVRKDNCIWRMEVLLLGENLMCVYLLYFFIHKMLHEKVVRLHNLDEVWWIIQALLELSLWREGSSNCDLNLNRKFSGVEINVFT